MHYDETVSQRSLSSLNDFDANCLILDELGESLWLSRLKPIYMHYELQYMF